MIKLIPPGSYDFGEVTTELVRISARGIIGHDKQAFMKRASHALLDKVAGLRLLPGEVPIHVIALGCTEKYGCFFAGTPVQTYRGMLPIEQVQPGELVLTHNNRFRPVTCRFVRQYTGHKTTIRVCGLPEPVVATSNHPFWIIKAADFTTRTRCPSLNRRQPGWDRQAAIRGTIAKAQFVAADAVKPGDFVVIPTNPSDPLAEALPDDMAYAMGVYLAEGCTAKRYREGANDHGQMRGIVFSLSAEKDTTVLAELRQAAAAYEHSTNVRPSNTSEKEIRVEWSWKAMAEQCDYLFGPEATVKFIHPSIFNQSAAWKLQFLAGYFDGDGCLNKDREKTRYDNVLRANTASLNLSLDLQRLLATLQIPCCVSKGFNKESNGCFGVGDLPIYEISIGSAYAKQLYSHCKRLQPGIEVDRQQQARTYPCGDYTLCRVTAVSQAQVVGQQIYNLEVEEDNTYVTLIAGHNSNRNGDGFRAQVCRDYHPTFVKSARWFRHHNNGDQKRGRGSIKLSDFNEEMGRIELIVALNGTKEAADRNGGLVADVELEKLARGEDIPTSMGTHVSHDICSGCGNKARYRSEYCSENRCTKYGGLKTNMGRTFNDGHTLHADNPDPDFFDISLVGKGADRISHAMGVISGYESMLKAASIGHMTISGAALAESLGVTTPAWLFAGQQNPWAPSHMVRQLKLASELLAAEDRMQTKLDTPLSAAFAIRTPANDLPDLRTVKLSSVMTALHSQRCLLPLDEFLAMCSGDHATKLAAQSQQVAAAMPGAFNRLVTDPNFEQLLLHNPYLAQIAAGSSLQSWAYKHASDWSLAQDRVIERLQRAVIRETPPVIPMQKSASYCKSAEKLANEYALYELAFLAAQPESMALKPMVELVVQNNYYH